MSKDELIRALASMRTDINKIKLALMAAPGQLDSAVLDERGYAIETYQANALHGLEKAADNVTELVRELGGRTL